MEPFAISTRNGIDPAASIITVYSSRQDWAQQDSNLRPTDYESAALTN